MQSDNFLDKAVAAINAWLKKPRPNECYSAEKQLNSNEKLTLEVFPENGEWSFFWRKGKDIRLIIEKIDKSLGTPNGYVSEKDFNELTELIKNLHPDYS